MSRTNAVLLYLLAVYIVVSSFFTLFSRVRPQPSIVGIVLLITSAIIMPWLGATKKRLARETNSGALRADAAQSNICAYMS
ncbi:cation transporter [Tunturibacter empetritectus]|uniref:cation transporter n=1 Tax=Tunturiibacter empetritectus TaxID=3069691 RepID=UPI00333EA135